MRQSCNNIFGITDIRLQTRIDFQIVVAMWWQNILENRQVYTIPYHVIARVQLFRLQAKNVS
jgi:hypothetical protein